MRSLSAVVLLFFFLNASVLLAMGGTDETHGGDIAVLEFTELLAQLTTSLQRIPSQELPMDSFAEVVLRKSKEVVIRSEEKVFFDGHEVNAINFPNKNPPEIVISRSLWNFEPSKRTEYRTLVLHEMLYLVGIDDDGFAYSKDLYGLILLYEEKNLQNLFKNYIIQIDHPLRESAYLRLQMDDTNISNHIELIYNMVRWATIESFEYSGILLKAALKVAKAAPDYIFKIPTAGCSMEYIDELSGVEAKEFFRFLKKKNVRSLTPMSCTFLKY